MPEHPHQRHHPHPFPLPPEDRRRSAYTGWTRAHWEAVADGLLHATAPYASPRHGLITLPGPRPSSSGPRSDGLEGFARTFLLAALRVAGGNGHDPHAHLSRYAEGLAAGTRRPTGARELTCADPDSWPRIGTVRQARVEAASLALGLRLTRPWLWDTLDDSIRARVADWLLPALGPSPVDNNWWLFGLTVGGFLRAAGIETVRAQAAIDRALTRIEDWYRGDGWYADGDNRAFDHYNAWAMHFYPVLHAHLSADRTLLATYGARLHAQLDDYTRLFDANGAPLPFGRSLTYRFAATAAPWLGALTGHTPLTPGATRRLASGALRHFLDGGAVTPDGLLPLGWYGPYVPMLQHYSGPASPYWAAKGFLGLLLPAGHPAWTDPEAPLPAETADTARPLGPTGLLLQSTASDGLVRLHNHGSNSTLATPDPYYARFAYSTRTGPTADGWLPPADRPLPDGRPQLVEHPLPVGQPLPDNHFGLLLDGRLTTRGPATPHTTGPDRASSTHTPRHADGSDLPDIRILSATLVHGRAELRVHLVTGAAPGTRVRQTGWATTPDGPTAQLHPVHGYDTPPRRTPTGSTLIGPGTRTAVLEGSTTSGPGGTLFAALASLTGDPDPAPVHTLATTHLTGHGIQVTWHDGTRAHLALPLPPTGDDGRAGPAPGS
ncbi:hypothetical protein SAMN05428954_4212 [Streptomyces sp. 2112.3]|uniref:DUF2264 domain-containing protein n=1 Tax=Streptomyces sp. 2112.3 TaxID=1881023 RepID=UPI0008975DCB|nr:DUF2264 domain-containing protein [Streptomyces sp. 2112.3]SEE86180.1 hypothetical protein SAMN05428954_4212 [Streptomyces sp. 2112.3]